MTFSLRQLVRHPIKNAAFLVYRNPIDVRPSRPVISFTFDDFPRTALLTGGAILKQFGATATYYVSLGLMGQDSPSGELMNEDDLHTALAEGHELGCHTWSHCHSAHTPAQDFREATIRNQVALGQMIPGARFRSLSYPISEPSPQVKGSIARDFLCCRSGGQTFNTGRTDLNQLKAYFLERGSLAEVKRLIDATVRASGWAVLATHDIVPSHGPYGCTPEFFEAVVRYAVASGALILPVVEALEAIDPQGSAVADRNWAAGRA